VSDTAGIRETEGQIEKEGIRRSLAAARAANLNVWLSETRRDAPPNEISRETLLLVRTKADLNEFPLPVLNGERARASGGNTIEQAAAPYPNLPPLPSAVAWGEGEVISISTKTNAGIDALIRMIAVRAADAIGGTDISPVVARARHRAHLETAAASLRQFIGGSPDDLELRAEDVRRAAHALGRITGRVDVEDVLDALFLRFCIGK
jgi:tRNA modification GTPase